MQIETDWTVCDGRNVAFQVFGEGRSSILLLDLWVTHLDLDWEDPFRAKLLRRMGRSARVIRFDKSGTGLSDRRPPPPSTAMEVWADEAIAVLDAVGIDEAGLYVADWSGPLGLCLAGRHPDRITRAVASTTFVALRADQHHPDGLDPDFVATARDLILDGWGTGILTTVLGQDRAALPADQLELDSRYERSSVARGDLPTVIDALVDADAGPMLSSITADVLVLYGENPMVRRGQSERMANSIAGARLETVERADDWHYRLAEDELPPELPVALEFLTGSLTEPAADRRLLTLLFVDVVDSTTTAARLGDQEWSARLRSLRSTIDALLAHHRGTLVDAAGDGFFATFTGPTAALRFALAIADQAEKLGSPVRTGINVGECVQDGSGELRGMAVHLAARIMAVADPSEILVSEAVAATAGATDDVGFEDRGPHELRGVPGPVRLLAVTTPSTSPTPSSTEGRRR